MALVIRNLLVAIALTWLTLGLANAEGVVLVPADTSAIDVTSLAQQITTERRTMAVELDHGPRQQPSVMDLAARGPGPTFNWSILAISNKADTERSFVLTISQQRVVASGIRMIETYGSHTVQVIAQASPQQEMHRAATLAEDTLPFTLKPGASITLAIESVGQQGQMQIFEESEFRRREAALSFMNGAMLALMMAVTIGVLALYSIRSHIAFPVSGLLAFSMLVFMAMETGYLPAALPMVSGLRINLQNLRGMIEAFLALGIAVALWEYQSRQFGLRLKAAGYGFIFLLGLLLMAAAAFEPLQASRIARISILLLAFLGFLRVLFDRPRQQNPFDHSGTFWSVLCAWVIGASILALLQSPDSRFNIILLAGLAAVGAVLAFSMVKLAFAQGYLARPFMREANRRSLALTGGQHFFWDWVPQDGMLRVGRELAHHLGYDPALFGSTVHLNRFQELIHPADAIAFGNTFNASAIRPNQFLEAELRLRDVENRYRWFAMRVRALPGEHNIPVRCIGTLTDITRAKIAEDNLISESVRDPVTGLPSRALFMDRLEREAARMQPPFVRVLMIDIQRFKYLNDGLGHELGDQLLLAAGQRIAECLLPEESIARISGSQFAVMMMETDVERSPANLSEKIMERIAVPLTLSEQEVVLSACIGISGSSADGHSANLLQRQAASALHESQLSGPRTALIFNSTMRDERADKVALETDLRRAIERHEIEVHYQPIFHLHGRAIAGFEALARWAHPQRGDLPPAEFIGMAEETGLIGEIGDLVLAEAARQLGIWQRVLAREKPIFVAVNVSADQLSDVTFLDKLSAILEREGILPQSLKIEITESVVMRYPERARQLLGNLRIMGVGVACDDFGTGFSSLGSLRDLQFDTLKMDRSFITAGGLRGRGGMIVSAVVNMAHSLGMNVVAEGIEDEQQAADLLLTGCDLGQGFLLGQPMHPRDVPHLLAVLPVIEALPPLPEIETVDPEADPDNMQSHDQPGGSDAPLPGMAPMAPRFVVTEIGESPEAEVGSSEPLVELPSSDTEDLSSSVVGNEKAESEATQTSAAEPSESDQRGSAVHESPADIELTPKPRSRKPHKAQRARKAKRPSSKADPPASD